VDAVRHMFRALAKDYGRDDVVCSGPMLVQTSTGAQNDSSMQTVVMTFEHVAAGLVSSDGEPLRHFEIAGVDGIYHPASAVIPAENRATIAVSSSSVADDPVSVRYAWHEEAIGNLANSCGLPAGPFRTSVGAQH
jgi:sialate O-acetylesterase